MALRVAFQTSVGTAQYPWLNKPDTKFDEEGVYKTGLIMSQEDASAMMEEVQELAKEFLGKKISKARFPWDQDEDTGEIIWKAKTKLPPKFFDTTGQYLDETQRPLVPGGSKIRLKGTFLPYDKGANCGVSMQINSVQIVDLSSGSGGFDAIEGSFVASSAPAKEEPTSNGKEEEDNFDF